MVAILQGPESPKVDDVRSNGYLISYRIAWDGYHEAMSRWIIGEL